MYQRQLVITITITIIIIINLILEKQVGANAFRFVVHGFKKNCISVKKRCVETTETKKHYIFVFLFIPQNQINITMNCKIIVFFIIQEMYLWSYKTKTKWNISAINRPMSIHLIQWKQKTHKFIWRYERKYKRRLHWWLH